MLGRIYNVHSRTVQKWSEALSLGPRSAPAGTSAPPPDASATASTTGWTGDLNPLADHEIRQALDDIQRVALDMTAHSDLTGLQRKLARLSILVAAKAPIYSWPGLRDAIEGLSRAMLHARRVEARLPETGADPVVLRKEAASQMMRELKSVLNPEEQAVLARVMKAGVDRLMKGQGRPQSPGTATPPPITT